MAADSGTLIVGACQAGVQLAASLRELGDCSPITLVGAEPHAPYQRPPLSKDLHGGTVDAAALAFRTADWYGRQDIDLVTGEQIVRLERNDDGGVAVSAGGRRFRFARLALATGAAVRRLQLEGTELDGVHYLRDAAEADRLAAGLAAARKVAVVGGGFIGLEVAAGARAAGKQVTVLEAAPRLVGRAVAEQTSEYFRAAHLRRGTEVVLQAKISRLTGSGGKVTGVELGDGTHVAADVVLIGVGVLPRTELAGQLGLAVDNGIVVDEFGLCSDGMTVAAGDCANLPNPYVRGDGGRLRLESVPHAIEHARTAAAALLGRRAPYRMMPWFWSDQADIKLQIAGLSAGYDQTVLRGDPDADKFSLLYYRAGRIIAADCINSPADFMAVKTALAKDRDIPADAAADPGVRLRQLIAEPAVR
ncbi:FAD-dependent oxidoreductase [Arthrobacter sp. I2-34]|uniref:FAD-dependent oxidoreductase n=1 Tax=Arthrobacter hankyongi TaxID=2904801 RepID=A0ABS9L3S3_9MICC|nr:FAD-dependent oxidoreductase [Arthrobacter hankyongi]MCG2621357.1 FAD-dependent oxidoreductase [Arthrobacter hankyongi]